VTTRCIIRLTAPLALALGVLLQGCAREEPEPPPPAAPVRESFHAHKPLRLEVLIAPSAAENASIDLRWFERELRHLLRRGQLRLASETANDSAFDLQVEFMGDGKQLELRLIAPDEHVERTRLVVLPQSTRLATISQLAKSLPEFLETPASQDWHEFVGTSDERVYESYLRGAAELYGATAQGVTRPGTTRALTRTVERLEALTRAQPRFARAWSALAVGYLSLGGEDLASLTDLAESSAERALRLDNDLADAHAALGLVRLRRQDWIAAQDKFEWALALDPDMPVALEGLACLDVDAGLYREALPFARRAVALQPRNAGAHECLTYAQLTEADAASARGTAGAPSEGVENAANVPPVATRVHGLLAVLAGDHATAERLLRSSMSRAEFHAWGAPCLRAANNRRLVPEALRAITRAANDGLIDAATQILCGAALREPDFVFNRIERLQKDAAHLPLRILWLPQADFLRKHPRFETAVSKAGLPAFWHSNGAPNVCAQEPDIYGCDSKRDRR
jgi:hypothetical protein